MNQEDIVQAAAILKRGGLVAFPTETVYGLGADAANPAAVKRLYAVKQRPVAHPVIVHLGDALQMSHWAQTVPTAARKLAAAFWPGPLTLILQRAAHVNDAVTGGQGTVGLRVPAHPVARALLTAFGGGIAAPSANRFGRLSATAAEHVREEFGADIDFVLDAGRCDVGIESTIVDVSSGQPALLRPGQLLGSEIERVLGMPLAAPGITAPRTPGTLAVHYAPATPLKLVPATALGDELTKLLNSDRRVAVLALDILPLKSAQLVWLTAPVAAADYAHDLYANLRWLDRACCDVILVERPPASPEWTAVTDRLRRAAG